MKIEVKDGNCGVIPAEFKPVTPKCHHWGYITVILLAFTLAGFSTYVALRNSKPVCNDLRPRQLMGNSRTLECVFDLGDIQEDEADIIIIRNSGDYIN